MNNLINQNMIDEIYNNKLNTLKKSLKTDEEKFDYGVFINDSYLTLNVYLNDVKIDIKTSIIDESFEKINEIINNNKLELILLDYKIQEGHSTLSEFIIEKDFEIDFDLNKFINKIKELIMNVSFSSADPNRKCGYVKFKVVKKRFE